MASFEHKGKTYDVSCRISDVTSNCGMSQITQMNMSHVSTGFSDIATEEEMLAAADTAAFDKALLEGKPHGNSNQFVLSGRANTHYNNIPRGRLHHDHILSVFVNSKRGALVRGFATDNPVHPGASMVHFILWTPEHKTCNIVQPYIYKRVPKKLGRPAFWRLENLKAALTVANKWYKCKETIDESRFAG